MSLQIKNTKVTCWYCGKNMGNADQATLQKHIDETAGTATHSTFKVEALTVAPRATTQVAVAESSTAPRANVLSEPEQAELNVLLSIQNSGTALAPNQVTRLKELQDRSIEATKTSNLPNSSSTVG